jgi:hypothetical protein
VAVTAWSPKPEAPVADCLAGVRQPLWRARYLVNSVPHADCVQLPQEVFALLLTDLPLAAYLAKVEIQTGECNDESLGSGTTTG